MGERFFQGFHIGHPDFAIALQSALSEFDATTIEQLRDYVAFLTNGAISPEAQMLAWWASGADFEPRSTQINTWLLELLDLLNEQAQARNSATK